MERPDVTPAPIALVGAGPSFQPRWATTDAPQPEISSALQATSCQTAKLGASRCGGDRVPCFDPQMRLCPRPGASSSAAALPMPSVPPVTSATRPRPACQLCRSVRFHLWPLLLGIGGGDILLGSIKSLFRRERRRQHRHASICTNLTWPDACRLTRGGYTLAVDGPQRSAYSFAVHSNRRRHFMVQIASPLLFLRDDAVL